jgi:hypothetical protein
MATGIGTDRAGTLRGTRGGDNPLTGGVGRDAITAALGDGGPGGDGGPVRVGLARGAHAGGGAASRLLGIEDAFGSDADDPVLGDRGANRLDGLGGAGTIEAGGPAEAHGGSGGDLPLTSGTPTSGEGARIWGDAGGDTFGTAGSILGDGFGPQQATIRDFDPGEGNVPTRHGSSARQLGARGRVRLRRRRRPRRERDTRGPRRPHHSRVRGAGRPRRRADRERGRALGPVHADGRRSRARRLSRRGE